MDELQNRSTDRSLYEQLRGHVGDESHIREYGTMGSGPQRTLPIDEIIYDVLAWLGRHSDLIADATGVECPSLRRMMNQLRLSSRSAHDG